MSTLLCMEMASAPRVEEVLGLGHVGGLDPMHLDCSMRSDHVQVILTVGFNMGLMRRVPFALVTSCRAGSSIFCFFRADLRGRYRK